MGKLLPVMVVWFPAESAPLEEEGRLMEAMEEQLDGSLSLSRERMDVGGYARFGSAGNSGEASKCSCERP